MWPDPLLSGIFVIRRSEDSMMVAPLSYLFAAWITAGIQTLDASPKKRAGETCKRP
jgi:hypothetical protein